MRIKGKEGEQLEGIVGDVVSKIMEEEEKAEINRRLENINKWYYRDPQGIVQGELSRAGLSHRVVQRVPRDLTKLFFVIRPVHEYGDGGMVSIGILSR